MQKGTADKFSVARAVLVRVAIQSLRARDRLTRSKRALRTASTGESQRQVAEGQRRVAKPFSKTGQPSSASRRLNSDAASAQIDAADIGEDLELARPRTRARRTLSGPCERGRRIPPVFTAREGAPARTCAIGFKTSVAHLPWPSVKTPPFK